MLNFCDFIQVFVFTTDHHLKGRFVLAPKIDSVAIMMLHCILG